MSDLRLIENRAVVSSFFIRIFEKDYLSFLRRSGRMIINFENSPGRQLFWILSRIRGVLLYLQLWPEMPTLTL